MNNGEVASKIVNERSASTAGNMNNEVGIQRSRKELYRVELEKTFVKCRNDMHHLINKGTLTTRRPRS